MSRHAPLGPFALREWRWLCLFMLGLAATLCLWAPQQGFDRNLYDLFLRHHARPSPAEILIVAIDDASLAQLGKWPWPRARHAALIRTLTAAQPRAIGMDVLFLEAEPGTPSGDPALADALLASNQVVLPMTSALGPAGLSAVLPVSGLAQSARALGHTHVEADPDGIVRSVFLREGQEDEWWPHLALALYDVGHKLVPGAEPGLPGARLPAHLRAKAHDARAWQRDYHVFLPFSGGPGHFRTVSYAAVLRGEVPATLIRDRYVLVGATAAGMADNIPTPVTTPDALLTGVEFNASVLEALLTQRSIRQASLPIRLGATLILTLLALLAYLNLSPRRALLSNLALLLVSLLGSALLLWGADYWLPPLALVVVLICAYPLWSWRRLEAAMRYLDLECAHLANEPQWLPAPADLTTGTQGGDPLERRILTLARAIGRTRDLRRFVSDSLESLPDATLLSTPDGTVLLANAAAHRLFAAIGAPPLKDALLPYLFAPMTPPTATFVGDAPLSWWHLIDPTCQAQLSQGIEVRAPGGRDLLIKSAACHDAAQQAVGWIVILTDISAVRAAERSRDETLRFLSHDMRAPQAAILALLEMQKEAPLAVPMDEFYARIERAARSTLELADNFVQLARAESQEYRFEELDFQTLLQDAIDEMWSLASKKRIRIESQFDAQQEYPLQGDRSLLLRMLVNLLSNAVKYSPPDTCVQCTLALAGTLARPLIQCTIRDQGYGMSHTDQNRLFQRFARFGTPADKQSGVGLGMVFVKAVLDRHRGQITLDSTPGQGSTFTLTLPAQN